MTAAPVFDRLASLADPIRGRLLLALESQELAVNELRSALQLPQSTVSRHLKVLGEEGWVSSRASGPTNWYRMSGRDMDPDARRLWQVVRDQIAETPAARRDAERIKSVISRRQTRSQEFFATGAGGWDQLRSELFGPGIERFALAGLLDPDWVVADLGTGTGTLAAGLAPLVRTLIAIDASSAMLSAARHRLRGVGNVEIRQARLESLPLDDQSVDLVFAVLVLHYLAEPERAVAEAGRVLRAGGRFVVVDMRPHERTEYRETMGHQWLGFDAETVQGWDRRAGLTKSSYRPLAPQPNAKGPLLFVATSIKPAFQEKPA
jgi:ArsR family transcriptional regulator